MSNKINMSFFNAYIELDKICAQSLGVTRGGINTYINRLVELRFAPRRNDVLPKLLNYRKKRNIIAHEENSFAEVKDITKKDVQWLNRFAKSVARKRDPVSQYNRKAHRYSIWKRVRLIFFALLILLVASAVVLGLKTIGII